MSGRVIGYRLLAEGADCGVMTARARRRGEQGSGGASYSAAKQARRRRDGQRRASPLNSEENQEADSTRCSQPAPSHSQPLLSICSLLRPFPSPSARSQHPLSICKPTPSNSQPVLSICAIVHVLESAGRT